MAAVAKTFYELSAKALSGELVSLEKYKGKVVLIENTAALWGTTTRDFLQMNQLIEKFGDKLAVLAFPCNQFGHQENNTEGELLNVLKYVRPGNSYEPKMDLFQKVQVNGENSHALFQYLRSSLPIPSDDSVSLMGDPKFIIWKPVTRTDIAWNFEKFLIGKDGKPFKRYSKAYETINLASDIEELLKK